MLTSYTTLASGSIQTGWTLSAAASTSFTIEFFASALGSAERCVGGPDFPHQHAGHDRLLGQCQLQ